MCEVAIQQSMVDLCSEQTVRNLVGYQDAGFGTEALMMAVKLSGFNDAPPTRAPSISG